MKILWKTRKDGGDYLGAPYTRAGFEREVFKITDSSRVGDPREFDWLIDGDENLHTPPWEGVKSCRLITDLHGKHRYGDKTCEAFMRRLLSKGYTKVLSRYRGLPDREDLVDDLGFTFLPWSVDTEVFQPKQKAIDVAFSGRTSERTYPLRKQIMEYVDRLPWKTFVAEAPKGRTYERKISDNLGGKPYANILNHTRILIFDCSIYRYPLQKFFEGTASGCVVMSTRPIGAEDLGLVHGETYVEITEDNWKKRLDYYLKNYDECVQISNNARQLAVTQHGHAIRAGEFVEELKKHGIL